MAMTSSDGIDFGCSRFFASLLLCTLCACATSPQLGRIGAGEAVAIEVVSGVRWRDSGAIRNQAIFSGMSVGASTGAVAGGLWGLVCGPFAVICIPAGAGVGALTGTVAGAAVGTTGALSEDKAKLFRERLAQAMESRDPVDELRRRIGERARKQWKLAADQADFHLTVTLEDIKLTSTRDERISLALHVTAAVRPRTATSAHPQREKAFGYVGPFSNLAVWLDGRGDFLETSLRTAVDQIAAEIVAELSVDADIAR